MKKNLRMVSGFSDSVKSEKGGAPYMDAGGGLVGVQGPLLMEDRLAGLNQPACAYGLLMFISCGSRDKECE